LGATGAGRRRRRRFEIDRIDLDGIVKGNPEPEVWAMVVSGSDDGKTWTELGHTGGMARPTAKFTPQ
jgi:hypothetical protein